MIEERVTELEQDLLARGSERSVSALPNFMFASYGHFLEEMKADRTIVAIGHDPLLVKKVGSAGARFAHGIFVQSPWILSALLVAFAISFERYWLLSAVPLTFLGRNYSTPNLSPILGCIPHVVVALITILGLILPGAWEWVAAGAACWLAWLFSSLGRAICQELIHAAMLRSETVFVWLYARDKIRVWKRREDPKPADAAPGPSEGES